MRVRFQIPLLAAMLLAVVGCNGPSNPPPPPDNNTRYGPPFGDIAFLFNDGEVATVSSSEGEVILFRGDGSNGSISDPGLAALWQPGSSAEEALLALYDHGGGRLLILDELGVSETVSETALPCRFAWSSAGGYLGFLEPVEGALELVSQGVDLVAARLVYAILDSETVFLGQPSYSNATSYIAGAVEHTDPQLRGVRVWRSTGEAAASLDSAALAARFSASGNYLAFLDGAEGPDSAGRLIITTPSLLPVDTIDFSGYAVGAANFAWAPDNVHLALYAGVYGGEVKLLVLDRTDPESVTEVPLSRPIALGTGEELLWAMPDWSPDSRSLVLEVEEGEGSFALVTVELDGTEHTLVEGLHRLSRPTWRK